MAKRLKALFLLTALAVLAPLPSGAMIRLPSLAEHPAFLTETPEGRYWIICLNDPVNNIDPLGLAGYFFGGTGNSRDPEGVSNVEMLFKAWDPEAGHGVAHYAPGVFSGYTPDGQRYRFLRKRPLTEGAAARTLGARAGKMMLELEAELRGGDKEVNVFGFSRGSTTALEFLNRIQDKINRGDPLYKGIKINFVALWDTVKTTAYDYRTELPPGMKYAHQPIHFIAIDEQRAQFFDKKVLDVQGALQIGYRGVHADVGAGYENSPFGWLSRNDAVFAAKLIGMRFDERTLASYSAPINWAATPTPNDTWFYNGGEPRTFPSDMYIHWSVPMFGWYTKPYNNINAHPPISRQVWFDWAGIAGGL